LAYTALRNGLIVDYAESADSYFANARNQSDLLYAGVVAQPAVTAEPSDNRSLEVQLQWQVLEMPATSDALKFFIHFIDAKGVIAFQADRLPAKASTLWKRGEIIHDAKFQIHIPANLAAGQYRVKIGLCSTRTGQRYKMLAENDGNNAYFVGDLTVSNDVKTMTFQPMAAWSAPADTRMNAKGTVVDFDSIRTDGMVSLTRSNNTWSLRAFPRSRAVTVQLRADRLKPPSAIVCDSAEAHPSAPTVVDGYWQVEMAGAKSCSWSAN
jgi:hypothetical protein